jgi:hypothetical protein
MPLSPAVVPLDEQQAEAADAATAMVGISNAFPLAPPPPKEVSSISTQTEIEVPMETELQVAELEAKLEEHSNQLASLQRDREAANSAHSAAQELLVAIADCLRVTPPPWEGDSIAQRNAWHEELSHFVRHINVAIDGADAGGEASSSGVDHSAADSTPEGVSVEEAAALCVGCCETEALCTCGNFRIEMEVEAEGDGSDGVNNGGGDGDNNGGDGDNNGGDGNNNGGGDGNNNGGDGDNDRPRGRPPGPSRGRGGARRGAGRCSETACNDQCRPYRKAQRLFMQLDDDLGDLGTSLPDALSDLCNRNVNVMGQSHEVMKAHDVVTKVVETTPKILKEVTTSNKDRPKLSTRQALQLKLATGMSYRGWRVKCQLEKRTGVDPNEAAMVKEWKTVAMEAKDLVGLREVDSEHDIDGVVVDVHRAVVLCLADLESDGKLTKEDLPETIDIRFSFDATQLKNGGKIVVIAVVLQNIPGLSCQSVDGVVPIAFLRCGENREYLQDSIPDVLDAIEEQMSTGLEFHGRKHAVYFSSYDLASWWMQMWDPVHQVQQSYNSAAGCCPFCQVLNTNTHKQLHNWQYWWHAVIPDTKHPWSFTPVTLSNSCYCPLHAELRLFGDAFLNHLADIADLNGNLEAYIESIRGLGVTSFNVEKKDNGGCDSTALQGTQCRKVRQNILAVIESTGADNFKWVKEDIGGAPRALKQQCRALKKNGCRCENKKQAKDQFCGQHARLRSEKKRVAICPESENVQYNQVQCDFKDHLVECAKALDYVLSAIQEVTPFYDDQYQVNILRQGKKKERPLMTVPLSCLQTFNSASEVWEAATPVSLERCNVQVRTSAQFNERGIRNLHHRPVEVVQRLVDGEYRIAELERQLRKLATEWEYCFSDESWTPYLHVVVCHTLPLMIKHKKLGHFSQQVVENFHKLVRWFYARTNREGGDDEHTKESSMNIMELFYGQKLLEMESREGEYNQNMVRALKRKRGAVCDCTIEGHRCNWDPR